MTRLAPQDEPADATSMYFDVPGLRLAQDLPRDTVLAQTARPSVAVVHDWCPKYRGGERVVSELCKVFDARDVFTLFDFLTDDVKNEHFSGVRFHTPGINKLPYVDRYYQALFFACPFLIEQFDVTEFDAVISSSAAFSRGVLTRPDQPHLCYVHTPARYAWDEQFSYCKNSSFSHGLRSLMFRYLLYQFRKWDIRTAHGPDLMIANSTFIRSRIRRVYGRDAVVVHPPVSLGEGGVLKDKNDQYITAAFAAPYKRTDLVIEAFKRMPGRRLLVVGEGQGNRHSGRVPPNIEFTGYLPRKEYVQRVSEAKAFVFAGCEDFGIALAEAQAWGTPVIALARGGAVDIVRPLGSSLPSTGVLFPSQSAGDICAAVQHFEDHSHNISPAACRLNASRFSVERFRREMAASFEHAVELNKRPGVQDQLSLRM